ncbi:hypothetical protein ACA910_019055 [Epithemia clementina (nom. ined.)]
MQRGGSTGQSGKKSQLLPIALWLQHWMLLLGSGKTYEEMREAVSSYFDEKGRLPQWDDKYDGEHWATLHREAIEDGQPDGNVRHEVGGDICCKIQTTGGTRNTTNDTAGELLELGDNDDNDNYNSSDDEL